MCRAQLVTFQYFDGLSFMVFLSFATPNLYNKTSDRPANEQQLIHAHTVNQIRSAVCYAV